MSASEDENQVPEEFSEQEQNQQQAPEKLKNAPQQQHEIKDELVQEDVKKEPEEELAKEQAQQREEKLARLQRILENRLKEYVAYQGKTIPTIEARLNLLRNEPNLKALSQQEGHILSDFAKKLSEILQTAKQFPPENSGDFHKKGLEQKIQALNTIVNQFIEGFTAFESAALMEAEVQSSIEKAELPSEIVAEERGQSRLYQIFTRYPLLLIDINRDINELIKCEKENHLEVSISPEAHQKTQDAQNKLADRVKRYNQNLAIQDGQIKAQKEINASGLLGFFKKSMPNFELILNFITPQEKQNNLSKHYETQGYIETFQIRGKPDIQNVLGEILNGAQPVGSHLSVEEKIAAYAKAALAVKNSQQFTAQQKKSFVITVTRAALDLAEEHKTHQAWEAVNEYFGTGSPLHTFTQTDVAQRAPIIQQEAKTFKDKDQMSKDGQVESEDKHVGFEKYPEREQVAAKSASDSADAEKDAVVSKQPSNSTNSVFRILNHESKIAKQVPGSALTAEKAPDSVPHRKTPDTVKAFLAKHPLKKEGTEQNIRFTVGFNSDVQQPTSFTLSIERGNDPISPPQIKSHVISFPEGDTNRAIHSLSMSVQFLNAGPQDPIQITYTTEETKVQAYWLAASLKALGKEYNLPSELENDPEAIEKINAFHEKINQLTRKNHQKQSTKKITGASITGFFPNDDASEENASPPYQP